MNDQAKDELKEKLIEDGDLEIQEEDKEEIGKITEQEKGGKDNHC